MSSWDDIAAQVNDLIDGRLSAAEERALRNLLEQDEESMRRYQELRLVVSELETLRAERAPEGFADRVLGALDAGSASVGDVDPDLDAVAGRPPLLALVGRHAALAASIAAMLFVGLLLLLTDPFSDPQQAPELAVVSEPAETEAADGALEKLPGVRSQGLKEGWSQDAREVESRPAEETAKADRLEQQEEDKVEVDDPAAGRLVAAEPRFAGGKQQGERSDRAAAEPEGAVAPREERAQPEEQDKLKDRANQPVQPDGDESIDRTGAEGSGKGRLGILTSKVVEPAPAQDKAVPAAPGAAGEESFQAELSRLVVLVKGKAVGGGLATRALDNASRAGGPDPRAKQAAVPEKNQQEEKKKYERNERSEPDRQGEANKRRSSAEESARKRAVAPARDGAAEAEFESPEGFSLLVLGLNVMARPEPSTVPSALDDEPFALAAGLGEAGGARPSEARLLALLPDEIRGRVNALLGSHRTRCRLVALDPAGLETLYGTSRGAGVVVRDLLLDPGVDQAGAEPVALALELPRDVVLPAAWDPAVAGRPPEAHYLVLLVRER